MISTNSWPKIRLIFKRFEQQVKAMEALGTNMIMEGVETYQKMAAALSPEQQSKLKSLFRESILSKLYKEA